ncbi:MAG: hypothetical protein IM578_00005 [Pseudanabaena sp. M037S2SP2A07QC]|nr:hypothetical protein [Pseudanabaena sp. M037S2SP2A07QC]
MAERSSAIFWVLNCPIYLLRCYSCPIGVFRYMKFYRCKGFTCFSCFSLHFISLRSP